MTTKPVFETCIPRSDIVSGTFNPELFTASLKQVVDRYAGAPVPDTPYTDPAIFFGEATYPTTGMRDLLSTVLRRLSGDATASAITRLESGFGGGKTHSLIGLVHCVKQGRAIASMVEPLFPGLPLPNADEVRLVAIAGDVLSVNRASGADLIPYTLWGELALQVGGEALYRELETDAVSLAAPGEAFFRRVLEGRKVLVMIDELAQYVARAEAAHPGRGAEQVAAFLMALSTFSRGRTGIAVVISLASSSDAFARQSEELGRELTRITGGEVSAEEARQRATSAVGQTESVVARDALPIRPVPASELSRVLSRRLFAAIDDETARAAASAYTDLYRMVSVDLPSEAKGADYGDRLRASYPFHPTFIDFLNQKLASIETFQGTRGVLRVMTLAIRLIWERRPHAPMIHVGHLDFSNGLMADEMLGSRLKANALQIVLNTDVGGPSSGNLGAGRSRAQILDERNPLPSRLPYHEMTWRAVLVNSLAGRAGGVASNLFGLNQADAFLTMLMPGLPATAIQTALEDIGKEAYYLRELDGKYFASTDPTINRALSDIRQGVSSADALELITVAARKVITNQNGVFEVREDVRAPADMADSPRRPSIGIIHVGVDRIRVADFIETVGPGAPRVAQNHVALLVPASVRTDLDRADLFEQGGPQQSLDRLIELAREVRAVDKLEADPGAYGLTSAHLDDDFRGRRARLRNDLNVAVTRAYNRLVYPGVVGITLRELRAAGGEGGVSIAEQVKEILRKDGEIVEAARAATMEILQAVRKLVFSLGTDTPKIEEIRNAFARNRHWPLLETPETLRSLVVAGVEKGVWCLFRFTDLKDDRPSQICDAAHPVPMAADLGEEGWSLIQPEKARARGWIKGEKPSEDKIREWAAEAVRHAPEVSVSDIVAAVREKSDAVEERDVLNVVPRVISQERLLVYAIPEEDGRRPSDLAEGVDATFRAIGPEDRLVARAEAARRGWLDTGPTRREFTEDGGKGPLLSVVRRLGQIYRKGGKSTIDLIRVEGLKVHGGATIELRVSDASPDSLKALDELLEALLTAGRPDANTFAQVEIENPLEDCAAITELTKGST